MLNLLLAALAPTLLPRPQEARLEGEALERAVEELAVRIERDYVFPEAAREIALRLREQLWAGAYEGLALPALAQRLGVDLRSVNGDRHLNVSPLPAPRGSEATPAELEALRAEEARAGNYGFQKLEILAGNVGYLELRGFAPSEVARATAVGALAFLAHCDALVIDLRQNGGGDPSMIQLLCSSFFAERTLLNTFEWRGREGLEEYWTLDDVPGAKLFDVPLFVLTSRRTFSAAEEFSYDLQCLRRATLVGETTGGGAHPGDTHAIAGVLMVFVPNGRAINPLTKTNWEGVGVRPEVEVPAERALDSALPLARKAAEERRRARR